ncbi:MAG: DUF896 domain-containing protein [Selenomonas sp.]|uniref:DUF896 domain-containing protein n=1 Tax=Selenomonas sp. TaxID=2053611 RepID=UPI0025DFEC9D|nr:DUF896 domain-containing protein [Selenomonas sp.]MCR5440100.1 DUF896 domain-containing protein [Selenomonas sp.]
MITPELIARINELARKKRSTGLSEAELAEQQKLRRIYLDGIRDQVKGMLDNIEVVDAPEKAQPKVTRINEVSFSLRRKLH